MNSKFIQDNILFLALPFLILAGGIYFTYTYATEAFSNHDSLISKREEKATKETKLNTLLRAKREQEELEQSKLEKKSESGKVIYEVLGQQFSPEASFGIMFENVLANIASSGIRIRSIEYNYQPIEDKILSTNTPGYNVCELSFTTVGHYNQIQRFFKNIAKENYLSNLYEVYIEPYDKNKNILISKFKIRLYTKSVNALTPVDKTTETAPQAN